MSDAIKRLRGLADDIDWHAFNNGGIPRDMRAIADEMETENNRLREMAAEMYPYAKAFLKEGVMLGCIDSKSHDWFLQLRELGIEVDE